MTDHDSATFPRIVRTLPGPRCPDCASAAVAVMHSPSVMTVQVQHSLTCPAWREPGAQIVLTFLPDQAATA